MTGLGRPMRMSGAPARMPSRALSDRGREDGGVIERAGPNDLMQLASDVGPVPMHIAALVLLEPETGFDLAAAVVLVGQRLGRVPRLKQRLVRPAIGCGPAYWLDHATFDPGHHVRVTGCAAPGDESALLDTALALAASPLPRSRPMWSATFVTGLARGRVALVLVMHHVVADGLGGLAVIGELVDDGFVGDRASPPIRFPRPAPSRRALVIDAWATRLHAIGELPGKLPQLIPAVNQLWTVRRVSAPRTSLNRPTGSRRQACIARVDLGAALSAAHARGGTVNDIVLTAVVGALGGLLEARGETVRRLVVSVPVSSRSPRDRGEVGNHVGVMLAALPVAGDPLTRLKAVVGITQAHKQRRPEASATLLQPVFRALGGLGVLSWCINHQRLVNTFVTNVPGPRLPVTLMNARVTEVIPIAGPAGNATVAFAVLSYVGVLTITVVADPDAVPELQQLTASLQSELDALTSPQTSPH